MLKDEELNNLVTGYLKENEHGQEQLVNVAQFFSVSPVVEDCTMDDFMRMRAKCRRIKPSINNVEDTRIVELVDTLLSQSNSGKVSIRTFTRDQSSGNPLKLGLSNRDEILNILYKNSIDGYYSIVNEYIDICDGGVSGVICNDVIEFSPNDTPRCVEKDGVCRLPARIGIKMLRIIYGVNIGFLWKKNKRIEFSIHTKKIGYLDKLYTVWEITDTNEFDENIKVPIMYPNNFSKHIGNKTFGLILAHILGLNVPSGIVINRNIRPFTLTTNPKRLPDDTIMRPAPSIKLPGEIDSKFEYTDVFEFMKEGMENVPSLILQERVLAEYSGAAQITEDCQRCDIEGVQGFGDKFMLGMQEPGELPSKVIDKLEGSFDKIKEYRELLGDINLEWVYSDRVWIVQFDCVNNENKAISFTTEEPESWVQIAVPETNLKQFRESVEDLLEQRDITGTNFGIEIRGNIGMLSHYGDIIREYNIPAKITKSK